MPHIVWRRERQMHHMREEHVSECLCVDVGHDHARERAICRPVDASFKVQFA